MDGLVLGWGRDRTWNLQGEGVYPGSRYCTVQIVSMDATCTVQ